MTKWSAISLLVLCEVLAMALWFSSSATIPALVMQYQLSDFQVSLISSSVNIGFVLGTLISAFFSLADRLNPKLFFMASALVAGLSNWAILLVEPTSISLPILRFIVGACMAGVYPVGMKMVASWADKDRGLLVGILVAALTLGSASPHLFGTFGDVDWRFTITLSSFAAFLSAVLILGFKTGPKWTSSPKFSPSHMLEGWVNKPLRLANFGYFGHMWELYAMWAWIGVFLNASFAVNPGGEDSAWLAKGATFLVIGLGAIGSLGGGFFADRLGRTTLTMWAMGLSGSCALLVGFLFGADPWILTGFCIFWGVVVIADSAQFSASVIELSNPQLTGTMVTVQTCVGFMLTTATIHAIPYLVDGVGWQYAFMFLAIGPFLGVYAMGVLRNMPEAQLLADGKK